ncbi:tyrosine-protein kinase CSK-like [Argonauta hians]
MEKHRGDLTDWRWFHGKISPEEAEEILKLEADGSYLIRESESEPDIYSLSAYFKSKVTHDIIYIVNNKISLDSKLFFDNLLSLLKVYSKDSCKKFCLERPVCDNKLLRRNLEKYGYVKTSDQVELKEFIDKGESCEVYEGCYQNTTVAVKKLHKLEFINNILVEANIMTTLKHRNLIQLIGVVLDKDVYLILDYMNDGSLVSYLRSRGRNNITAETQINISFDICTGMAYIESKHLVHCDLAARNVLLSSNGHVKISDFGLSKHDGTEDKRNKLPVRWTAPEAIKTRIFTNKCDVWSFGVLVWEIFAFGKIPYPQIPTSQILQFIEDGNRLDIPVDCSEDMEKIIVKTWNINPEIRPSFKELQELMHPFIGVLV